MSFTKYQAEQINLLYKKFLGVPDASPSGPYYTEFNTDSRRRIFLDNIYNQMIPSVAPTLPLISVDNAIEIANSTNGSTVISNQYMNSPFGNTSGYCVQFVSAPTVMYCSLTLTSILQGYSYTYSYNGTNSALTGTAYSRNYLKGMIPQTYDFLGSYGVCVYVDGAQRLQSDINYQWIIDGDSGVLTFFKQINADAVVYITFWKYIGTIGSYTQTGFMGMTGYPGIIGSTGDTGCTGQQGPTGMRGQMGYTGSVGLPGFTGMTGPSGQQGLGYTGQTGPTGQTGAPSSSLVTQITGGTNIIASASTGNVIISVNPRLLLQKNIAFTGIQDNVVIGSPANLANPNFNNNVVIGQYVTGIGLSTGQYNTVLGTPGSIINSYMQFPPNSSNNVIIGSEILGYGTPINNCIVIGNNSYNTNTTNDSYNIVLGNNVIVPNNGRGTTGLFIVDQNIKNIILGSVLQNNLGVCTISQGLVSNNGNSIGLLLNTGNTGIIVGSSNSLPIAGTAYISTTNLLTNFLPGTFTATNFGSSGSVIVGTSNVITSGYKSTGAIQSYYNTVFGNNNIVGAGGRYFYPMLLNNNNVIGSSNSISYNNNNVIGLNNNLQNGSNNIIIGSNNNLLDDLNMTHSASSNIILGNGLSMTGLLNNTLVIPQSITNITLGSALTINSDILNLQGGVQNLNNSLNTGGTASNNNAFIYYGKTNQTFTYTCGTNNFTGTVYFERIGNSVTISIDTTNLMNITYSAIFYEKPLLASSTSIPIQYCPSTNNSNYSIQLGHTFLGVLDTQYTYQVSVYLQTLNGNFVLFMYNSNTQYKNDVGIGATASFAAAPNIPINLGAGIGITGCAFINNYLTYTYSISN